MDNPLVSIAGASDHCAARAKTIEWFDRPRVSRHQNTLQTYLMPRGKVLRPRLFSGRGAKKSLRPPVFDWPRSVPLPVERLGSRKISHDSGVWCKIDVIQCSAKTWRISR